MLSRRILTSSSHPPNLLRTFSTSAVRHKVPALSDLAPNNASAFDTRQSEFREAQKEAQKAQERQDSQFVTGYKSSPSKSSPGGPTAQGASDASSGGIVSGIASKLSLGSLSTATPEAAREQTYENESSKRKGALASLIYGTKEGQQMDQEIEKSFSQVLARGKYVHSIIFHKVKPDKVEEYTKLVGAWYPKMAHLEENHVHLVGSWRTEVGDCDTFGLFYPQ